MTYHIQTEEKKPQDFNRSIICTQRKNIGMDKEHVNEFSSLQLELKEIELDFLNKQEEVIKDPDGSPKVDSFIISGEIDTTQESGENDDETKDDDEKVNHEDESVEETDVPASKKQCNEDEDGLDSEDKSDDENEDEDAPDQILDVKIYKEINEIYDELDAAHSEKDNAEFERILDYRFQKGTLILKFRYYSETLAEGSVEDIF
eukprot:12757077-Ditylum_brightwellii.AAC.1